MNITTIITNLIFAIINVFLIEYYLKNLHELKDDVNMKLYYVIEIILALTTHFIFYYNISLSIIFNLGTVFIATYKYKLKSIEFIKVMCFFVIFATILSFTLKTFFEAVFYTVISTQRFHFLFSYSILIKFIEAYIELIFITFLINSKNNAIHNIRYFKIISIFLSIYFSITILVTNKTLFYFPSVGRTFVFVIFVYNVALIGFNYYQKKYFDLQVSSEFKDMLCKEMKYTFDSTKENIVEVRRINHSNKDSYYIVRTYIENDEKDKAISIIDKLIGKIEQIKFCIHLGEIGIDSAIDRKIRDMEIYKIDYHEEILNVCLDHFDCFDIALLTSLAFDNAIEACEKVEGHKEIGFSVDTINDHLILHFKNSIVPGSKPKFNKTSKIHNSQWHGFGVGQIKGIVKKYNGEMNYKVYDDYVDLRITLQGIHQVETIKEEVLSQAL